MEKQWILVDVDGTLADADGRAKKYLRNENPDWDAYFAACGEDGPITPIIDMVSALRGSFDVVLCTGRRESCDKSTREWLDRYAPTLADVHILYRKEKDHRHDVFVKPELLEEYMKNSGRAHGPVAIFEDRNSMVEKWRELGFTCVQVAEGDF